VTQDTGTILRSVTDNSEGYPISVHTMGGRDREDRPNFIGRWTFQPRPIRDLVEDALEGRVLNATAGKTRLDHDQVVVRNDINPDIPADIRHDVTVIDEHLETHSFDTVVLDPPFDTSQADKRYEGFHARDIKAARDALDELVAPGGVFIEFGWSSRGVGCRQQWDREALHLFQRMNLPDVFASIDRKAQTTLGWSE
jgi:hypothetical protein